MFYLRTALTVLVVGLLWSSAPVAAQPLGTFRWQLLPYCNILTLNVSQQGGIYTLDGTDDRCSAGQAASARGLAFLNPNGTIGFGVTMVQPGGVPVHLEAAIGAGSFNGTWRDSSGASGNFVLTVGAGISGPPRVVAPSGVPPASITSIQLAPNAVSGINIVDGSITPQKLAVPPPRLQSSGLTTFTNLPINTSVVLRSVTLQVPSAGQVMVNASGLFGFVVGSGFFVAGWCSISTGVEVETSHYMYARFVSPTSAQNIPFAGTRVYNVAPGTFTANLVCTGLTDLVGLPPGFQVVTVQTAGITALFVPN